jgi:probable phosphoglycerate mutase
MNNFLSLSTSSTSSTSSTPSTSTTKIILVRHARTNYNEQGRYQVSSDDSVLTVKGHQDAFTTGLTLQQYKLDAIYTSPLKRVRQTTEAIVAALDANDNLPPVFIDSLLTEIGMSNWQGLSYQEVKEKFPEDYHCWQNTPHLFSFNHNFYPVLELFDRAKKFWNKILTKHRGETILVVAHGGTNRALISTAVGLKPENYHSLQQSNCGISCLEFSSGNYGELKYLNVTDHLGETLPKLKAGKTGWRWLLLSEVNTKSLANYSYLTKLIYSDLIDLILTDNSPNSELLANKISTNNTTVHLSISQNNFLDNWRQTIFQRQSSPIASEQANLTTGLIIASDKLLNQILDKTLNITALNLTDCLAVIHYPQKFSHSILQGSYPL